MLNNHKGTRIIPLFNNYALSDMPLMASFNHVQMDGSHAAYFLEELQKTIKAVK